MSWTVSEAKNKLPELIKQAEAGGRVTITKRGIPVVEIIKKQDDQPRKRIFGGWETKLLSWIRTGAALKTTSTHGSPVMFSCAFCLTRKF